MPRCEGEVGQSAAAFARTLQDCGRSFCTRRGLEHKKREVGKRCLPARACTGECGHSCEALGAAMRAAMRF